MNEAELLPCPFCGGRPVVIRGGTSRQSSIIECSNCAAKLESNESPWNTGSNWNRRALPVSKGDSGTGVSVPANAEEVIEVLDWLISERFKVPETDNLKFAKCIEVKNKLVQSPLAHTGRDSKDLRHDSSENTK